MCQLCWHVTALTHLGFPVSPPPPDGGAAKCSRQNVSNLVRSAVDANGTWAARFPQFGKQAPRSHQATQKSTPALLVGGDRVCKIGRNPPGRTTMLVNSESGLGFSIGATTVRGVSFVRDDKPVRADAPELGAVYPVAMVLVPPLPAVLGFKYPSGIGNQLLEFWKVPCRKSQISVR